ncbi:VWD domain-containing protein [Dolichospermum circinale CS-537/03]|uniref:bluetail domain-containing putative surface protein n=1 Tax=Dolichospermum circinale TaxID=109265 RepID=UPI00048571F2|nr:bluetail domain-containing putative surface protein [Dolichospermum circinale]MDB9473466.1 VWD domain-containing protein [Dolichospermum circinale CS-537/11]MDB9480623.1 VWD domain-containing protein [Dolichospermum circinale CS-537/03]
MTNLLQATLNKTYNQLKNFAGLNDFWNLFEIAFGTQYDHTVATNLRSQWLVGDFSSFPQIEILDSSILGNASGAYGTSTNKIYLAANFLDTATETDIIAVLLEEYGHFIDAHINQTDSAGDEGDIFSNLVRGNSLSAGTLQALKGENDHATITLDGQSIEIEQNVSTLGFLVSQSYFTNYDTLNRPSFENVRTIGNTNFSSIIQQSDGYRARFKYTKFTSGPNAGNWNTIIPNTTYPAIPFTNINSVPNPSPLTYTTTITPLTSTVKGLIIHTADNLPPMPNPWGAENWSEANNMLNTLAFNAAGNKYLLAEDTSYGTTLNVGRLSYSYNPITPKPLEVTLVWTNPTGINNLDVWVKNTITNVITAATLTGTDTSNSSTEDYEQIYFTPPATGTYDVFVGKNPNSPSFVQQDFSVFFTSNPVVGQGHGWGDVHLVNFDGKPYDFQAVGEFILVKSLIDDFQVQTRQKPWGASTTVSVNTAFATTIDGYNVVFDTKLPVGQQLKIDGATYNLLNGQSVFLGNSKIERTQATDPKGGFVDAYILTYAGPDGIIATSDDDKVTAYDHTGSYINIFVDPADYRFGVLQGLLGNGDGVSTNDFALRNGTDLGPNPTVQTIHTTYADSWRITQQESLFGTPTFANKSFPANYVSLETLAQQNPQGVANAFAKGREFGIAEGAFLNGGVFDFVVTGDEGFLKGAKLAANLALKNGDIQIPLGSIQGSKWNDVNGNGIWETTEKALAGWTIYIDSVANGKLDPWELSTVTNADGQYTFSNLGPGEYAIREVNQTGWIQTFPTTPYALNLKAGEKLTGINFGNYFQLPTINLSPSNQTVVEGLTTPQNASYTVTLSQASNQTVSLNYATANGTATAGLDYTATNGTLTFAPGATSQVINIPILNDSLNEADETFTLTLSSPTNASLGAVTTVTTTITDTLTASVTTTLPANVENLTLTGAAAINGTGNAGNNVITGNTGNNILNGGAGTDTLIGGLGDDIYVVDSATDTITELANGGTDTIQSSVTYTIAALANVENLTLTGAAAINGAGNTGNNVITGNTGNNILNGGAGNDILTGGVGKDTLTGGLGVDRFDYRTLTHSILSNFDVITDFNATTGNDLFLVFIARSGFSNVGSVATLDTAGIAAKLTNTVFTANSAAQFTFGTRTFVAINDATAGFSATTDAIIEVTGLTGTLGISNFTTALV